MPHAQTLYSWLSLLFTHPVLQSCYFCLSWLITYTRYANVLTLPWGPLVPFAICAADLSDSDHSSRRFLPPCTRHVYFHRCCQPLNCSSVYYTKVLLLFQFCWSKIAKCTRQAKSHVHFQMVRSKECAFCQRRLTTQKTQTCKAKLSTRRDYFVRVRRAGPEFQLQKESQ